MLDQGPNKTGRFSPLGQSGLQTGDRPGTKPVVGQAPYNHSFAAPIKQTPYSTGGFYKPVLGQTPYSTGKDTIKQGEQTSKSGPIYKNELKDLIPSENY